VGRSELTFALNKVNFSCVAKPSQIGGKGTYDILPMAANEVQINLWFAEFKSEVNTFFGILD